MPLLPRLIRPSPSSTSSHLFKNINHIIPITPLLDPTVAFREIKPTVCQSQPKWALVSLPNLSLCYPTMSLCFSHQAQLFRTHCPLCHSLPLDRHLLGMAFPDLPNLKSLTGPSPTPHLGHFL